jgi:hypothetical protein
MGSAAPPFRVKSGILLSVDIEACAASLAAAHRLAVSGIPDGVFYKALARAWEMLEAPVDLLPLDSCPVVLRQRILARGVNLDA